METLIISALFPLWFAAKEGTTRHIIISVEHREIFAIEDYGDDDQTIQLEPEYAYYDSKYGILDEVVSVGGQEDENTTTYGENSAAPDKRRNNETKTKDVNSKGQNEIASNDINTITGNKIEYAAAKNNNNNYKEERLGANELERIDIDDKLLIQGSKGKRRIRRDLSSEIAGERKDQRSDVVHKRQATTDTVYDWSVDELSDSEKWQVDRIDPARKTFVERLIGAFNFLKKYPTITTPILIVVGTILAYCCFCCITPGMVLCCCDPRSTGKKSAEKYMVGLRKDAKGNYVIDDITDYERDAAGGAADIF
ncbi:hypothetical protein LSAT2_029085 [Lamellibrachia satsuma]|nr:hypothetical protein LSAT2_029085 [Lamellibrachia satsuma]